MQNVSKKNRNGVRRLSNKLPPADEAKIFAGNALKLFKLKNDVKNDV